MSHILAYAGSDPRQVARALGPALEISEIPATHGWGLGYEQEGQILLRKTPQGSANMSLARLGAELRTRAFIGSIAPEKSVWPRRPENCAPFRWRGWIFAAQGTWSSDLIERRDEHLKSIPDFLIRNVQGDTPQELFFHLVLSRMKRNGVTLQSLWVPVEATLRALREVWVELERAQGQPMPVSMTLTDGRSLFCLGAGPALRAYRLTSLEHRLGTERRQAVLRARRTAQVHAVVVTEGEPAPEGIWEALPARTIWAVEGNGEVHKTPLAL